MGGKSQPDFGDIAVAEGEEQDRVVRNQLYANRPTQYTPWGYTNWTNQAVIDPATGEETTQWSQTQGLTPELQDILNKQIAIQGGRSDIAGMLTGRMGGEFGQQMDWRGLNPMGQVPTAQFTMPEPDIGSPYETRQRAEDAVYGQAQSRLAPRFESQRESMEIKLRNQGIGPEDAAWQAQMGQIDQQETDAYNQAQFSAVGAGRDESSQMWNQLMGQQQNRFGQAMGANQQNFGQAMQQSQYANQIRQQQMTEAMQKRGFSLNEINALLSGQQVGMPSMPSFNQSGVSAGAPIMTGAAQQASMQNASNPWNALIGAAGTAGGAYLGTL